MVVYPIKAMTQDQTYSVIIKKLMKECNMTLHDIAREGKFSIQSMYNWESGERLPQPDKREKLLSLAKEHQISRSENSLDLTFLSYEQREVLLAVYDYITKESERAAMEEKGEQSNKKKTKPTSLSEEEAKPKNESPVDR